MTEVRIVGIGCHPGQLTAEARAAIASCDYVIAADKGADDPLLALRRGICDDVGVELVAVADPPRDRSSGLDTPGYDGAVLDWHDARAAAYASVIAERPGTVGFLVWGDPAFYDSTIRVVERLGVEYDVLPGVSAISLLAARHRLVLHEVGRPVLVTTGRRLADEVAAGHDNLVVMLDGRLQAASLDGDWDIWWGANLGSPHEELVAGRLADVVGSIGAARARAKQADGWVMDTYLLRRA
ncbi:precorrin-6A synthase (deacetylating) [Nocardioides hwasunensis]|uniref:Precorrin-6A synthase (Deacetylating) n=1 Tax=Nocardioides hwasunensis TaxID=397258 RepID=A0ABR8MLN1_9ACTN|nr:precorrin-6A synthase (deacetylating) [Nocardioides hwasunensis]MBD3916929.1 precorrin-6A synthase (deacetylating) [Nocardioides hwasunensis]